MPKTYATSSGSVPNADTTTTANITDSTDKRFITDAQRTVLQNTSGTNSGDQTSVTGNAGTATALQTARTIDGVSFNGTANITVIAPGTNAASSKVTPVDADAMPLVDSESSNTLKKVTWANIKATIKAYYDAVSSTLTNKSISLGSNTVTTTVAQLNTAITDGNIIPEAGGTFTGDISVPDEAYGAGWNGSLEVPTKNALYAKIETIGGGGGGTVDVSGTPTAGQMAVWVDANTVQGVTGLGISDLTAKTTPVDADTTVLADSADSNNAKKVTWANVKATLKTYFDTLYRSVSTSIGTSDIANDAVTYAKMQNVSATDKLLGRSTSGAGDVEEIACTAAGRAILDDADAAAQRTTLGLAIGANVQAYDADLSTIAGLTATTDNFMQAKSSAWASRTPSQVAADLVGTGLDVNMLGFRGIPQNSQSAAYTCVEADGGKHIFHPTADNNARTFTIPANASVAFVVGTAITFVNQINTVTIAITSDTLRWAKDGSTGSRTLAANGIATALKITSTEWLITGEGLT